MSDTNGNTNGKPQLKVRLNDKGNELLKELLAVGKKSRPVLLLGPSGGGKSVLVRSACKMLDRGYEGVNFTPGMDISTQIGMWTPKPCQGGITVEFSLGAMSRAAEKGSGYLGEELTRSPQEMMSRFFNILNDRFRSLEIPEAGMEVNVKDTFWFIATANALEEGYNVVDLDVALKDRFCYGISIQDIIVDEKAMLQDVFEESGMDAEKDEVKAMMDTILKIATLIRGNQHRIPFTTRNVSQIAQLVSDGFELKKAIQRAYLWKIRLDLARHIEEVIKPFFTI